MFWVSDEIHMCFAVSFKSWFGLKGPILFTNRIKCTPLQDQSVSQDYGERGCIDEDGNSRKLGDTYIGDIDLQQVYLLQSEAFEYLL